MRSAHASIRRPFLSLALLALIGTPAADASDTFSVYQSMASKMPSPAPLVVTWFPAARSDEFIDATGGSTAGVAQYSLRFAWRKRDNPMVFRAIVFLQRGRVRTLGVLRRELRGYTVRPTRVRGRPALLFTRRGSPGFYLAWVEQGRVHELLTGQPKRVALATLRRIADSLEPLGKLYVASAVTLPDGREAGAVGFATKSTVSLYVDFAGTCTNPDGTPSGVGTLLRSGQIDLAPLNGGAFAATFPSRSTDPRFPS